ncbi:MAG: DUF1772 domain-containing protein [Opitutales bacterium]
MNILILTSLIAALLGTALITGILFIFSNTIMHSLSQVPAPEGIRAMQTINRVIQNPLFFLIFFGTTVLSVINGVASFMNWGGELPNTFIAASAFYMIGVFIVTAAGNVPMNNKLDTLDPNAGEAYWKTYLKDWTRLNHIRSATGSISIVLYTIGLLQINWG